MKLAEVMSVDLPRMSSKACYPALHQNHQWKKTEVMICEKCAQEKGEMFMDAGGPGFSINNLLAGLLNMESNIQQTKANAFPKTEERRCPHCHRSYKEFVHIGKFGCAECYKTFNEQLNPILKRVHSGNTAHIGKIPKGLVAPYIFESKFWI